MCWPAPRCRARSNPRQVSAYHYPSAYVLRSPTFSRAALVSLAPGEETLLVSGTASIVGHETCHVGDVAAQTAETLRNLEAVLASAHRQTPARFDLRQMDLTVYLRDPGDRATVEAVLGAGARRRGARPAQRAVAACRCSPRRTALPGAWRPRPRGAECATPDRCVHPGDWRFHGTLGTLAGLKS